MSWLFRQVSKSNNNYHCSISKKTIEAHYSTLTEEFEPNPKAPKFKVGDRVRSTKYKNILSKGYIKYWSKELFVIGSVMKTNPWTFRIKDSNRKNKISSFYEKELLLRKL